MNSLLPQLPTVPKDRTGWPWTEETDPAIYAGRTDWPRISIVTPSYHQGEFIEETIRSIVLQNYPNLEFIIMDGGSTDETVAIMERYDPWITHWVSEQDEGQTHAINKGFHIVTGEYTTWINSDDLFLSGAFYEVATQFTNEVDFLYGQCLFLKKDGSIAKGDGPLENLRVLHASDFPYPSQPSCFYRPRLFRELGYLDQQFHFSMDFDLFIRIGLNKEFKRIPERLTKFRWHEASKTSNLQHLHNSNRHTVLSQVINTFKANLPDFNFEGLLSSDQRYASSKDFSQEEKRMIVANALKTMTLIAYTNGELSQVKRMGQMIRELSPEIFAQTYVSNLFRRSRFLNEGMLKTLRSVKSMLTGS